MFDLATACLRGYTDALDMLGACSLAVMVVLVFGGDGAALRLQPSGLTSVRSRSRVGWFA